MTMQRQHQNCPGANQPRAWNPTPGLLRAAFITLGPRKHRVGYVCLVCGYFQFAPDAKYVAKLVQLSERRPRQ